MNTPPIPARPLAKWLILAALPCSLTTALAVPVPCDDFPTDLMPAPSGACEVAAPVRFGTSAVVLEQVSLRLPSDPITPPPEGSSQTLACDFTLQCRLSLDNGTTFHQVRVPASASIKYTCSSGQCALEMLSLDASLPGGVMLRESPTKGSLGQTKRSASPLGGFRISSFFDIFTELSTDDGQTWTPASGPARAVQCAVAHEIRSNTYVPTWTRLACVAPVRFAPSVLVRNTDFTQPTDPIDPPAPGASVDCITHTTCTGEVSLDGGTTFNTFGSQAVLTMRITADSSPISSITRHFATEILDLTVTVGDGAAGGPSFKLRESPTKQSLGKTSVRRCPDGSCRISSFFDVFLELSMNSGDPTAEPTWIPATDECSTFASYFNPREYRFASDFLPLPASLVSDDDSPVGFGETGVALWRMRKRPEILRQAPPSTGQEVRQMDGSADLLLSRDGGGEFIRFHVPVLSDVVVSPYQIGGGHDSPVECVSFSCTVPGPTPVMLRESPTKQSLGTSSKRLSNGEYMIGQSTQVCLEVSLDNGTTWTPADAPLRLSLLPNVEQTCVCKTDFMPPRTGTFEADPPDGGVSYALSQPYLKKKIDKWLISNCSASQPPPARRGDTAVIDFSCTVSCDVSEDDGATWVPFEGPGTCTMSVTNPLYKEDSSVFNNPIYDTEMLALIVTLPNGMKVRESPTKASTGKTSMRNRILELESRSYAIDSFFDVFTELSVDNGQTWIAADDCVHLAMHNAPDSAFVRSDWMPYATQIRACDGGFSARVSSTGFVRGLDFDCDSSDALFSARAPMPAPGSPPVIQEMTVPASFEYSTDGGTTHTTVHASAALTLRCDEFSAPSSTSPVSSCRIEVLQCDISGLPGAPMLRESPTKQSMGKTACRPAPGGYRVESFFDIFLELSFDGGGTWLPACDPLHMGSVETSAPVVFADNLIPPPGVLASHGGALYLRTSAGKAQGGLSVPSPNVWRVPAPAAGETATVSGSCTAELSISNDDGATFNFVRAPLFLRYEMKTVMTDSAQTLLDTEMLQFECAGGSLPTGWKLRESPTLPSKGKTSMRPRPDGGCATSSFFDVFLELSTDGGRSWSPFDLPLHLELGDAPVSGDGSTNQWPLLGIFVHPSHSSADDNLLFLDGSSIDTFGMTFDPAAAVTLPPPGSSTIDHRTCTCPCGYTVSATVPRRLVVLVGGPSNVQITARPASPDGIRSFDTEMLSLDLTLPDGTKLRESPTKQSLGRLHRAPAAAGTGFTISSFFDVFLDISTDGGATWSPADRAIHLDFATPDLAVAGPNGADLTNGSPLDFGSCLVGSPRELACVLTNHGQAALNIPSLSIIGTDGASSADFTVFPAPPFTLPPNGGTQPVTVTFASIAAGEKSAVLHLVCDDPGKNPFDLSLTGRALVGDADEDGDGLTNAQELAHTDCGFDPLVPNSALLDGLRADGFYRSTDMHALALGRPVLARDAATGNFHLRVGVLRSPTLSPPWTPMLQLTPTFDPATGQVDLEFAPPGGSASFFQVFGQAP